MDRHDDDSQFVTRFEGYVDKLSGVLGHRDRHQPFREYCTGLLLTGGRKSVEPVKSDSCWINLPEAFPPRALFGVRCGHRTRCRVPL